MAKIIGKTNANYHIMTGARITSKRAYELGLVSHVFENEKFNE